MNPVTMSASDAKLNFGAVLLKVGRGIPVIVEKNAEPAMVCISMDEYEDYLELNDKEFQKSIEKSHKEIESGNYLTLDDLYETHRKTIEKTAKKMQSK